jgi:DNA mismatch repair protein MutS
MFLLKMAKIIDLFHFKKGIFTSQMNIVLPLNYLTVIWCCILIVATGLWGIMKRFVSRLFILVLLCSNFITAHKSIYKKIQPINLSSLSWEDEEWPNEPLKDYLQRCFTYQHDLQEMKKRRITFRIFDSISEQSTEHSALADITTAQDLLLLAGKEEGDSYVGQLIDCSKTQWGKVFLLGLISAPICDEELLIKRQNIIKEIINNVELKDSLERVYDQIAISENMMLSLWGQDGFLNSTQRIYYSLPYLSGLSDRLNHSSIALEIKSLWGHQQRAVFLGTGLFAATILPIYGMCKAGNIKLPAILSRVGDRLEGAGGRILGILAGVTNNTKWSSGLTIAAGVACAFTCKEDYEWLRDNVILEQYLQKKMILISHFFNGITELNVLLAQNPEFIKLCPAAQKIVKFMESDFQEAKMQELFSYCKSSSLQGESSLFSYQGRVLAAFKLIYDLKPTIEPLLLAIGELDAYCSCARLYQDFSDKNAKFCFVTYKKSEQPFIAMQEFWNPFINAQKVVTNSATLAGPRQRNMIITGPNAGGKSTLIKAIPINLILAQSIGMAAASCAEITPFYNIATYLNIIDDIASGNSLFKAQVLRAQEMVNVIEQTPANKFSFVALDEMFNGTSSKESKAAAYSVVKHIGKYTNNICIVATHFPLLTQLEQENNAFVNYKVSVNVDETGIHYPFKLEEGSSNQHIALEILKQEGYDCSILDEASKILNNVN